MLSRPVPRPLRIAQVARIDWPSMNTHTNDHGIAMAKTINGTTYVSIPDPGNAGCNGCVGYDDDDGVDSLCYKLCNGVDCWEKEIKWVKAPEVTQVFCDQLPGISAADLTTEAGRKFDNDKPQFNLVPPKALIETVKVLTYGAQKYAPDNWRKVPEAKTRYFSAAMRHLWSWAKGETKDPETGISHLAHALCSIMFMLELELEENQKPHQSTTQ